jgi:hypothetical protein
VEFLELIAALLVWRFLVSLGTAAVLAFALSRIFLGFTAGYCITLVLLGVGIGLVWQARATEGHPSNKLIPAPPISAPVAALGYMFIGLTWGGVALALNHSWVYGALLIICTVGVMGICYRFVLRRNTPGKHLVLASTSMLVGFALILLLTKFVNG